MEPESARANMRHFRNACSSNSDGGQLNRWQKRDIKSLETGSEGVCSVVGGIMLYSEGTQRPLIPEPSLPGLAPAKSDSINFTLHLTRNNF